MSFERLWHKSYAKGVPGEIDIEKITMAEILTRTAERYPDTVSYTHLRAHETVLDLVCRLLLEKKNTTQQTIIPLNREAKKKRFIHTK